LRTPFIERGQGGSFGGARGIKRIPKMGGLKEEFREGAIFLSMEGQRPEDVWGGFVIVLA